MRGIQESARSPSLRFWRSKSRRASSAYERREVPSGVTPYQGLLELKKWIAVAIDYTRTRKNQFRFGASAVKLLSLVLSAAATIILGLQNLSFWAGLAFSLVALGTVVNAIEPFFNWRSRWVLMEEARSRFYQLEDDINILIVKTAQDAVSSTDVDKFYKCYRFIWDDLSLRWLEQRRGRASGQIES